MDINFLSCLPPTAGHEHERKHAIFCVTPDFGGDMKATAAAAADGRKEGRKS
jgi:hypothetical protein